jgi:hypothetical protein
VVEVIATVIAARKRAQEYLTFCNPPWGPSIRLKYSQELSSIPMLSLATVPLISSLWLSIAASVSIVGGTMIIGFCTEAYTYGKSE